MDDDEEEDGPVIGKKPRQIKQPNPLNEQKREREREAKRKKEQDQARVQQKQAEGEQVGQEQAQQGQGQQDQAQQVLLESKIPPFGDGSHIFRDWTTSGLFDDPILQYEDTCGSVVFARLLQASYNKDRPIAERRDLSYRDLSEYIKGKSQKEKYSFRNLNIPIKYIRNVGLHRDDLISGPGVKGVKTKGDFDYRQDATRDFVHEKLDITPLGIIIQVLPELYEAKMGDIYVAAIQSEECDEQYDEHALLVLAKGATKSGLPFLVVQNSWGKSFGNSGYFRLLLPSNGKFKIFWPV